MKTTFSIVILILLNTLISSQVSTEWVGIYSRVPQSINSTHDIVSDANNNVFVTGSTRSQGYGSEKFVVIKYSPTGIEEWVKILPGFGIGKSIAIDRNGYIVVGGQMKDTFNVSEDYCVVKFDQNGNLLWLSRYDGPMHHYDYGEYMIIDSSNNIYITGTSYDTVTYYATVKYNSSGGQQWVKRYKFRNGGGLTTPVRLALDNFGNLYLSAYQFFASTDEDFLLIKYDINGNQLWSRTLNTPGDTTNYCVGLDIDKAGNVIVTGIAYGYGMYTFKYNPQGMLLWTQPYLSNNNYSGLPSSIIVDSSLNIYIAGSVNSPNYENFLVLKYDANGTKLWEKSYSGTANQTDRANDLIIDKFGYIYSTGFIVNSFSNWTDYFTVKLDQSGNEIWQASFNSSISGGGDLSKAITLTNSNKVVVTGESPVLPNYTLSMTTVQYSQPVGIEPNSHETPKFFNLFQNYPNPFNPSTEIKFDLPKDVDVTVKIFDILGREVTALMNKEFRNAGRYKLNWNSDKCASGVYIYRIEAGDYVNSRKMVLIK